MSNEKIKELIRQTEAFKSLAYKLLTQIKQNQIARKEMGIEVPCRQKEIGPA